VVRDEDYALWKVQSHAAALEAVYLAGDALIACDADLCRGPPFLHCDEQQPEVLLGEGLPGIVVVAVVPVKRNAEELLEVETGEVSSRDRVGKGGESTISQKQRSRESITSNGWLGWVLEVCWGTQADQLLVESEVCLWSWYGGGGRRIPYLRADGGAKEDSNV